MTHRSGVGSALAAALRASIAAVILSGAAWTSASAQAGVPPTAVTLGAPATAELGQSVTLQARLVDDAGAPVAGATVLFTSPTSFLSAAGDVVLARATTGKDGLAMADYRVRRTGRLTIQAEYRGSARLGPSKSGAEMLVEGPPKQLYSPLHAAVHIPGLNAPPQIAPVVFGRMPVIDPMSPLWSNLGGWPIGAVLLVVWSSFLYVVVLLFRVAAAGTATDPRAAIGEGRSVAGAAAGPEPAAPSRTSLRTARLVGASTRFAIPTIAAVVVVSLGTVMLTFGERSPYTYANLLPGFDPAYTRTDQTLVGPPVPYRGEGLPTSQAPADEPLARGRMLLIRGSCAACHGLVGQGGTVGPPIVGFNAADLRQKTDRGPGGMPAFAHDVLTDDDLAAIASYLQSRAPKRAP